MFKNNREIDFGGCIKIFLKNLRSKIFFFIKIKAIIFENPIFAKKTYKQLYFFFSDLNLECFQLSFDVYIVYIDKNCEFLKIFMPNWNFSAAKLAHFGATLRQNYKT